jgi:phage terminase large subunit GpA-like protein
MTRRQTDAWLRSLWLEWLTIKEQMPSQQWVAQNIVLPREVSQVKPGPIDLDAFPLSQLIYDWFDDPKWRELIIVKGSQGAISQTAQNLSCYIGDHQLGDIMWTLESDKKVVELNNERLKPMITKSCASLRRHLYEQEDKKLKNRILILKGLKIVMAGARTASAVASRPVPFIFGDEVDEWPTELEGNESNALTLLRERAKLFSWAKLLFFSKPRNALTPEMSEDHKLRNRKKKDDGIIWGEYLSGTRHKCHIPCPRCGHFHEIVWENVRFQHCRTKDGSAWDYAKMEDGEDGAYLMCPSCQNSFRDEEKTAMILKHRQWVQTNIEGDELEDGSRVNMPIPRKMSAHMSDLYANTSILDEHGKPMFSDFTLGRLAVKYCSATSTSDRRAFRRGVLGLPVEKTKFEKLDIAPLLSMAGTYARGTVPTRPAWTDIMIDVQGHGKLYKWLKLGYGKITGYEVDDTTWIIDHGETESEEELEAIFAKPIPVLDEGGEWIIRDGDRIWTGKHITSQTGWIDEGDGTTSNQVLNICVRPRLFPRFATVKGRGGKQTENMTDRVVLQENRTHKTKRVDRYLIDADYFLDDLYEERIGKREQIDQAIHKGQPPPAGRLWFFANASRGFLSEFCTEKKDWHLRLGKLVFGWLPKPVGGKNDFSDLVKYGLAKWYRTKPAILKALDKRRKEAALLAAANAEKTPAKVDT